MRGVEVRVKIDNSIPTSLDPECSQCAQTLSRSGIMDLLISVNWQMLDSFNLKTLDRCLHLLSTSIRGAMRCGFTNSQSKSVMYELVGLVRQYCLCDKHNLRLNVSSPYSAEDCGGVVVEVDVRTQVSPNSSDTDSGPSGAFTSDSLELRGVPDLSVVIEENPSTMVVLAENKKDAAKGKKRRRYTWKEGGDDSHVGQLLYYLVTAQLRPLKLPLPSCH